VTELSRREAIAAATAGAGLLLLGCGSDEDGSAASTAATTSEPAATPTATETSAANTPDCILAPEQTEGPYYIDDSMIRADVTEDREGAPLALRLQVVNANDCEPIMGATVEIWHCDALGNYSGFSDAGGSDTYLRGGLRSDASGYVDFKTIYPGWYQGRTTHIHLKVHVGGEEVHTGQIYFDDAVNTAVYTGKSPYKSRGDKDQPNEQDGIYGQGGEQSTVRVTEAGTGYSGQLALGVRA
jgi:protocatechuate 3,4-dioxygenase beta subunit